MNYQQVSILQTTFNVSSLQASFWNSLLAMGWEAGNFRYLAERLTSGHKFLDIGAWIGPYTLFAAARGCLVSAVEPDPIAFQYLERNVAGNKTFANRVLLLNAAIGLTDGTVKMGNASGCLGDSTSSVFSCNSEVRWVSEQIALCRTVEQHGWPEFVKMDIEGAEFELLDPLFSLYKNRPLRLLLSTHLGLIQNRLGYFIKLIGALNDKQIRSASTLEIIRLPDLRKKLLSKRTLDLIIELNP